MSVREKVLVRLLEATDSVSRTGLSSELGVSRGAIWKHVTALRQEGYQIAAGPGCGYRLAEIPDALHPAVFLPLVKGRFGRSFHFYPVVSSTNDVAKGLARRGAPEGTLVVAEQQTGGRGRRGRAWHSPPGGLWFSLVLYPPVLPAATQSLPLILSLAVQEALTAFPVPPVALKWPNDLVYRGRKIGGILVELGAEAEAVRFVVAGIGLNVNITSFPPEVAETATSLKLLAGKALNRAELLATILVTLEDYYVRWCREGFGPYQKVYEQRLVLRGCSVEIDYAGQRISGTVEGVDVGGHLILLLSDGTRWSFAGGEVSLRGKW